MRTTYRSALVVMMLTVVFAAGCLHPSTNSRSPSVSASSASIKNEGESSATPQRKISLVAHEVQCLPESQGLSRVGQPLMGEASVERPIAFCVTTDDRPIQDSKTRKASQRLGESNPPEQLAVLALEERQSALAEEVESQSFSHPTRLDSESDAVVLAGLHRSQGRTLHRRECMNLGLGNISSNIQPYGFQYLAPYLDRVPLYDEPTSQTRSVTDDANLECPPSAWWESDVISQARPDSTAIRVDIESLLVRTLANSKYLQGLADLPLIREKSTLEAAAEFDVTAFMESRFRRPSDPVGNQLTVGPGGSARFRENDFAASAGIARKNALGGRVQFSQEVGLLNNNSTFIDPRRQGNSRLTLNITQPLMSGSGKAYNTSLIVLAQMDQRVSWDDVSEQLQDYLVEVTETYWQLYFERARLKQKQRHLQRGEGILVELEQRREIDAVENQIARARAAVQSRRSELIRAKTAVRNTESRLRSLVNDPQLQGSKVEVVPTENPQCAALDISMHDAMSQALQSRSEIDKSIQKVRAAGVRLSVAKNELLPILNVVLETYLSGLRGNNDIGRAWIDQFSVGEPSYSAGIRYEIPINNRVAKYRHERRRLEMRQAISQFQFNVEELMSEVEIAVREVNTTHEEMLSRHEAMVANEIDLNYFRRRWELIPGDNRSASFLLEDILEAQDRVAAAESNFANAQVNYAMSIVKFKRTLGILLQSERIETVRTGACDLGQYIFRKTETIADMPIDVSSPAALRLDPLMIHGEQATILPAPEGLANPSQSTEQMTLPEPQRNSSDEPPPTAEPLLMSDELSGPLLQSDGTLPHPFAAPVTVKSLELLPSSMPVKSPR